MAHICQSFFYSVHNLDDGKKSSFCVKLFGAGTVLQRTDSIYILKHNIREIFLKRANVHARCDSIE